MKYWYDKEFKGICCDANNIEECLDMIQALAFDYDGYESSKDLKDLVDELAKYAGKAAEFLAEGKITEEDTHEEDEASFKKALKDREEAKLNEIK